MLTVEGLSCRYGKVEAVRDLTISVEKGELVTLIGANGAGKTTTLKAISGVLAPAAGRIAFLDNAVDQTTGTIKVRAIFDNTDAALWPGQFYTPD